MRLFLSSYRFGAHQNRLLSLVGEPGRVAVIANACDAWPSAWQSAVTSDLFPLRRSGFQPEVLDLRDYIDRPADLERTLAGFPMVWVRGGNTFVLRAQFARSGADLALTRLLAEDAIVYAGYSAGACVMTPDLHGLESMDDPAEVRTACGIDPIWEGLALVDRHIVPHLDSPTDPEGLSRKLVRDYTSQNIPHWALTDDHVVVVDGDETTVLT
ncbi:Type 1 glutamine amidotransferase-like domain-containing protein [Nocardia sp. NPDC051030]|uniref:Type 1 glutamine amidotransferase-like domain-containing protein n=1 Tax=Nocardia sp. NPDC051030 TaxID=3155162 RepID=UPI003424C799